MEVDRTVGGDPPVAGLHEVVLVEQRQQVGHVIGQEQVVVAEVEDGIRTRGDDRLVSVRLAV